MAFVATLFGYGAEVTGGVGAGLLAGMACVLSYVIGLQENVILPEEEESDCTSE